jgi:hypothetical protein
MHVWTLDGPVLNYWVAKSAGLPPAATMACHPGTFSPADDWAHAGCIISEDWFAIEDTLLEWFGPQWSHIPAVAGHPLKWFMRAYVSTQIGNEVDELSATMPLEPADALLAVASPSRDNATHRLTGWLRKISW